MADEHEHHHAHDHGHEHGHAHDHEHEADEVTLIDEDGVFLSLLDHAGSLVASYRFTLDCSLDEAKSKLSAFALAISNAVDERGGLVGHVKAFAREQGDAFRISVTTDTPDVLDFPGRSVLVEGVAIVVAVDKEWYQELVSAQVRALVSA